MAGVEALVRWQHPQRGLVPPDEFIPLAEQTGLIGSLTRWVLSTAVGDRQGVAGEGLALPVAVNLSMRDLHDPKFPTMVLKLLHQQRLPAEGLRLEVTESSVMSDPTGRWARSARCAGRHSRGDRRLRDRLLLTRLLEAAAGGRDQGRQDLRAGPGAQRERPGDRAGGSDLGHHLGMAVVAEGVEDELTWELLKGLGCDAGQGFYFSRPLEPVALRRWIRESPWGASVAVLQRPLPAPRTGTRPRVA